MPRYECYSTAWNNPHIVEELIPAKGLEFSMPLSDHGTASFTATVEPGRSFWRPAITPIVSGVLIARDSVPVWQGWVTGEQPSGPRSFTFQCVEWGAFFERVPAQPKTYTQWNDHALFRDLISTGAASASGRDPGIVLGSTLGASRSDLTVNEWDDATVERLFRELSESDGGPEWYFGTSGTMDNPVRRLYLGDRLGFTEAETVLEYVEDTVPWEGPGAPPSVVLLGDLFPVDVAVPALTQRRGGNVIAQGRTRESGSSATEYVAIGSGEEKAQKRSRSVASQLLARGWPRLTRTESFTDVTVQATLDRHAKAGLAASAGITTGYSLVTLDGEPDWTTTPRGSNVRVILDTDVYGGERPVGGDNGFEARLLNTTVRVDDDGPAQVQWDTATVLEGD